MDKTMIKKIRTGLLMGWMILGVVLLILIQYARINVGAQDFVMKLVWIYLFGGSVVGGAMASLKRLSSPEDDSTKIS